MSLSTSVNVLQDTTGATPVAGTPVTFVNDGQGTNGKKILVDSSQGNVNLRKKIITSTTVGNQPVTGLAKLHRGDVTIHQPYIDAKGVKYNLADSLTLSYHPAMTQAERLTKFWNTISILIDSELLGPLTNMVND